MTRSDEFALFVAVLAEASPGQAPHHVVERAKHYRRMARRLHRFAEADCNGTATPTMEKGDAKNEAEAVRLGVKDGYGVKVGGDPRGYCLKLILPTGRYNTWGGAEEGWGVPT